MALHPRQLVDIPKIAGEASRSAAHAVYTCRVPPTVSGVATASPAVRSCADNAHGAMGFLPPHCSAPTTFRQVSCLCKFEIERYRSSSHLESSGPIIVSDCVGVQPDDAGSPASILGRLLLTWLRLRFHAPTSHFAQTVDDLKAGSPLRRERQLGANPGNSVSRCVHHRCAA